MTTVHCTIETDPESGTYIGWVVGFRHFAVTGATPDDVEAKLRSRVLSMHDAGSLMLDAEFVRLVSIALPPHPSDS